MSDTLRQDLEAAAADVDVRGGDLDKVIRQAHRRVRRRHQVVATIMVLGIMGATAAALGLAGRESPSASTAEPSEPPVTAPFDATRPTRSGLIDLYDDPRPGFPRVDRVAVKKTTWGDVRAALRTAYGPEYDREGQLGVAPDEEVVYVVVQAGVHVPSAEGRGGEGEVYNWGAMVFVAEGGRPVMTFGRRDDHLWPTFFDRLEDLGGE